MVGTVASRFGLTLGTPTHPHTPPPPSRPARYRMSGLDGLRAVAALAVLAYHIAPQIVPGGFLGVDVFFVLSGFLITGLLVEERAKTGRISLTHFWLRRVRRLLPAVTAMIIVMVPVAAFTSSDLIVGIGKQILGALGFVYNWVSIASGASYFDQQNPQIFMNVWSLGVEEQFYLVWPLVVVGLFALAHRASRRTLATVPLVAAAASAGWMAYLVATAPQAPLDPTRAYQGTDSHCFGLMVGAGLALALHRPFAPSRRELSSTHVRYRGLAQVGGLLLVGVCLAFVPDSSALTYPWWTLVATLGVVAYLQGCVDDVAGLSGISHALTRGLDTPVLRWLGERSYGIYLWHWPIIVCVETAWPTLPILLVGALTACLSIGAAAVSFALIETPMRRDGIVETLSHWVRLEPRYAPRWHALACLVGAVCLVPATIVAWATAPEMTSVEQRLAQASASPSASPTATPSPKQQPRKQAASVPEVVGANVTIIGDSVTLGAKPTLEQRLPGVIVDGEVSRSILKANPLIAHYRDAVGMRPYIVVSLATNSAITDANVDEIMAAVGDMTRVVFVTGYGPARDSWITQSNEAIARASERFRDRIRVADWHAAAAEHTDWLAPDATHPVNAEGEALYAQTIVDALHAFADKGDE